MTGLSQFPSNIPGKKRSYELQNNGRKCKVAIPWSNFVFLKSTPYWLEHCIWYEKEGKSHFIQIVKQQYIYFQGKTPMAVVDESYFFFCFVPFTLQLFNGSAQPCGEHIYHGWIPIYVESIPMYKCVICTKYSYNLFTTHILFTVVHIQFQRNLLYKYLLEAGTLFHSNLLYIEDAQI